MSKLDFVDVSHHQGEVPWNRYRDAGAKGGICKATDGYYMPPDYKTHIDPQFARNWQALNTFNLRGAYGFNRFDVRRSGKKTPAQQMKFTIDTIGDHKETNILAWDVEEKPENIVHVSLQSRADMLAEALQVAEKHWDKEYIWIYSAKWWWNLQMLEPHIDPMPYILSFSLWMAYYGIKPWKSQIPKGWTSDRVIAHQYSATKKIAGITTDHNEFKWDWEKYLKLDIEIPEPLPPEPPKPKPIPVPPSTNKGCLPALIDIIKSGTPN